MLRSARWVGSVDFSSRAPQRQFEGRPDMRSPVNDLRREDAARIPMSMHVEICAERVRRRTQGGGEQATKIRDVDGAYGDIG